jgi:site-specific DNA recombinase
MSQRAIIYARVSLDQTGEGASVARQEQACQSLADARGYEVVGVEKDSQSAYTDRIRPGWERVKAAAERGEVDVILAWQLDRVTRSMAELEQLIDLTERTGASLATVAGDLDLTTSTGRMLARILGAVARAEVETKAARQRLANQQRAAEGKPWTSGPTLFGYGREGEVVENEAEAIREAAHDVLNGVSCYRIAKRWSEAGLFPRSTRRQAGAEPNWTPAGVKLLLVNPRLAGLATYRGKEVGVRGSWEPIIDDAQHIQLKAFLTDSSRRVGGSTAGPKPTTLLSTVAVCAKCERTLQAGKSSGRFVYLCKDGHVTTPRFQADMLVTTQVVLLIAQATGAGAIRVDAPGEVDTGAVEALRRRLDELAGAYAEETITLSQLNVATARLMEKIEEAEAASSPATTALTPEEAVSMFVDASLDGQRAMLQSMFAIKVKPRGRGRSMPIEEQIEITPRSA